MVRPVPALLAVLLTCGLGACGDGDGGEPGIRIEIETFSFDGEAPAGLRLRRVDPGGVGEGLYDLVPVAGGPSGEYEAQGAPDGSYRVEGPAGWWMLHQGATPPQLGRGLQPPRVGLGRARSLYLGAQAPGIRPSAVWGAVRIAEGGEEEPVPVTVEADDRGYVVALRFTEEAWHGSLQVVGRVASGPPRTPAPAPSADAPLAEPIRFEATEDGRPVVTRIRQGPSGPLDVVLVPAAAEVPTDGLRVRATIERIPIRFQVEAYGRHGVARFPSVPLLDRPVRLEVGDEVGGHRLAPGVRRRQSGVRLLVLGAVPTRRVLVLVPAAHDVDLVQMRPAGAQAYGRVPFERADGQIAFAAPRGPVEVLLRAGERWAALSASGDADLEIGDAVFSEGVVVGGTVDGAKPGTVVRFFRAVGKGGEAVLGDGFELRVEPSGVFEGRLPTGRWLVEVATPTGVWRRPALLLAESPGARLHVPLDSP